MREAGIQVAFPKRSAVRHFCRATVEYHWGPIDSQMPSPQQELKFQREPEWSAFADVDPTVCPELAVLAGQWNRMDRELAEEDDRADGIVWPSWEEIETWPTDDKVAPPAWDGTIDTGGGVPIAPVAYAMAALRR